MKERFGGFLKLIGKSKEIDGYKGNVVICISHAMFLKQTKAIHTEQHEIETPEKRKYKLGGISVLKWLEDGEKYVFLNDGHNAHIEQKGLCRYKTYKTENFVWMEGDIIPNSAE